MYLVFVHMRNGKFQICVFIGAICVDGKAGGARNEEGGMYCVFPEIYLKDGEG